MRDYLGHSKLSSGLAFYGQQKALLVGDQEFFLDLLLPPLATTVRDHRAEDRRVPARVRVEDELLPERRRRQLRVGDDRESVEIILCAGGDATLAKLALHRVYAPIAVSTWKAGMSQPELPEVEITDDVPADRIELAELDAVRTRLIERVSQRSPEIIGDTD